MRRELFREGRAFAARQGFCDVDDAAGERREALRERRKGNGERDEERERGEERTSSAGHRREARSAAQNFTAGGRSEPAVAVKFSIGFASG